MEAQDGLEINSKSFGVKTARKYSLAFQEASKCTILIISTLIILAHALFLYGQIFPMWRLFYKVDANVTLEAVNAESEFVFSSLNLENPYQLGISKEGQVRTFTYSFAIKELWKAKDLSSTIGPRIAAFLLILFSGVWPHLKLLLLHCYWLFPSGQLSRSKAFYWLSTFGKWSFADVFVVCILIGVLNLDFEIQPQVIIDGLISEFPELVDAIENAVTLDQATELVCQEYLGLECGSITDVECESCYGIVGQLYKRPAWLKEIGVNALKGIQPSGGGQSTLRVGGLWGIYIFCCAVVLSLLLSFIIDIYDRRARTRQFSRTPCNTSDRLSHENASDALKAYLNAESTSEILDLNDAKKRRSVFTWVNPVVHVLLALLSVVLVSISLFIKSMERDVEGSLPEIADTVLGLQYDKEYSLWSLTKATAASGGADYFLMGIFGFFCVAGPLLRASLCAIHFMFDSSYRAHQRWVFELVSILRAFCAWEVFTVALLMVDLEMPQITNTIINEKQKICQALHQTGQFPSSCFTVDFDVLAHYGYLMGAWIILIGVSYLIEELHNESSGRDTTSKGDLENTPAYESDSESYRLLGDEQRNEESEQQSLVK
mmetsp:Transcript_17795/g.22916  ORF Transcript_17795/g.22916 Transcript_17795/m.22916 type:complete len:603 (-) Transcript_17795:244-2052(-)